MGRADLHKVSGIVLPERWGDNDHLLSVLIYTPDDEEYVVKSDSMGKKLFSMLDENVEVVGIIRELNDGRKIITVKNFNYVGREEEEVENDYENDEDEWE